MKIGIQENVSIVPGKVLSLRDPYLISLIILYSIAFFPMLFCNGIYWDDWVWTGLGLNDYFIISQKLYAMFFPGFVFMLFNGISPLFGHWVAFVCYLIPGLLLYKYLNEINYKPNFSLMLSVLFLLVPVNGSKYTLATGPYAFYFALFALASYIFIGSDNKYARMVSLVLFFLSFNLNSLLPFFAVPYFYSLIVYLGRTSDKKVNLSKSILLHTKGNWYYAVLPFTFFGVKSLLMSLNTVYKSGIYAKIGYNKIVPEFALKSPLLAVDWLLRACSNIGAKISSILGRSSHFALLVLIVVVFLAFVKKNQRWSEESALGIRHMLFGLFSFFFGVFAYIAVGIGFYDDPLNSRNNMLIPLGLTFLLFGLLEFFSDKFELRSLTVWTVMVVIIFSFIMVNLDNGRDFYFDNIKQQSLIINYRNNELIKKGKAFVVEDNTIYLNAGRTYNSYDFAGLFYAAFGDETRIAAYTGENSKKELEMAFSSRMALPYKMMNATTYSPDVVIRIDSGSGKTGFSNMLRLLILSIVKPRQYQNEVANFVNIKAFLYTE
ncbi:hypothetical protein [Gracilinema caldarium]|uniref:Glycosyltransferase RgtA/B/C/D-like domain-containing protein n=1 Tax=Gracilinema caldarium (strain ATCC 51460 / DSM 7334 / H1) TaxID=744872 RepID=F8F025_GRAC1|nr:hypothetical protein [Gracilinema caldarium]AEJ18678.1 hypothetical protein Spica_0516 [Gracilinema caldarium DSM 7334]